MPGLIQAIFGNGSSPGTGTSTRRWPTLSGWFLANNTIAANAPQRINHACTISDWRIRLTVAPGVGVTRTFTVYKNGSATSLVVAISGTNQENSDLSNSVTFASGDTTYVEMTTTGGTPADTVIQSVFTCENPDGYTSLQPFGNESVSNLSTSWSNFLNGGGEWTTLLSGAGIDAVVGVAGTITGYTVQVCTAPGAGGSGKQRTFVVTKNGTDQDGTGGTPDTRLTVSETATSGSVSFSLSVSATDLIRLKTVPVSSPAGSWINGTATFVSGTIGKYTLGSTTDEQVSTAATEYHPAFGNFGVGANAAWNTDETIRENIGPDYDLTVSGLYVALTAAPGSGKSYVITLRKNQTDTGQTVTISDLATTGGPSGAGAVTFTDSDRMSISSVPSGAPAGTRLKIGFLITDLATVETATIASASTLYSPSLGSEIQVATIASTLTLYAPSVEYVTTSATISSTLTLFAPTVTVVSGFNVLSIWP